MLGKWKTTSRELSESIEEDAADVVELILVLPSMFEVEVITKSKYVPPQLRSILEFSPNIVSIFTFSSIGIATELASSHGSSEIGLIID